MSNIRLFDFAFCGDFEKKIYSLSLLCPEQWSLQGAAEQNTILKSYVHHTFSKLYEDSDVAEHENYAVFNTGLHTKYYETIYAYFTENKVSSRQRWYLEGFFTTYQLCSLGITNLPRRANYFGDLSALVFDPGCDIIPQYQHIFGDPENLERIPADIRENENRVMMFDCAIAKTKQMIDANYKTAVPQYYKGRIQLLVPICLHSSDKADLALVVSKNSSGSQYLGHTCLTLDMAYNNARLIAKLDSRWLTLQD